jgi:hypothetical protein
MSTRTKLVEYHLIDVAEAISKGGFKSLEAARQYAREEGLAGWRVYKGDKLIERHEP